MAISVTERARFTKIARISHDLILRHQDPRGAYPASPTFSAYAGYSWLRDGAFIAEGMSRYGNVESASAFHDWVAARLVQVRPQVDHLIAMARGGAAADPAQMLPTRFAIANDAPPDEWWNFQTDGYGMWPWAVVTHARRHGLDPSRWREGIEVAVDYVAQFWDSACYDWWEENVDKRHGSTLAAIYGGLSIVAEGGVLDARRTATAAQVADALRKLVASEGLAGDPAYLTKWIGSTEVDASLASAVVPFGLLVPGSPVAQETLDRVRAQLDVDGGVHRYLADVFYGGGQWLLLSCLVGWNEVARGDIASAEQYLRWVAQQLTENQEFPEQVPHHLLHPEHRERWEGLWGPVATPLLWSHGMYLILADELGVIER